MSPLCRTVVGTGAFLYRTPLTGLSGADAPGNAHGHVAEWLRSGLQNRLPRFNSGRGLHKFSNDLGEERERDFWGENWLWVLAGGLTSLMIVKCPKCQQDLGANADDLSDRRYLAECREVHAQPGRESRRRVRHTRRRRPRAPGRGALSIAPRGAISKCSKITLVRSRADDRPSSAGSRLAVSRSS
jgi:hypothetical protein